MCIIEYLKRYTVLSIGTCIPGYICCESIVENPKTLISLLKNSGYYISEIRWWDRVAVGSMSTIGYGGPRDPNNPNCFYYAETDIYMEFGPGTTDDSYNQYIDSIKKEYPTNQLFPAFDIRTISEQGQGDGLREPQDR